MGISITSTTQLSTFSTIKTILKANSTLSFKFRDSSYYEFEPNLKSISSSTLPYIVINVPNLEGEHIATDNTLTLKRIEVPIILAVDYPARDKYIDYANAIVSELEGAKATFETSGYYDTLIELDSTDIDFIKDKQIIIGTFTLSFNGVVTT